MSISTADIKKKITATENMSKITKAMQMVSVAKLSKTEERLAHFKGYREEMSQVFAKLQQLAYVTDHPLTNGHRRNKNNQTIGIVLITSNRGLVGGYNNQIYQKMKEQRGFNSELFEMTEKVLEKEPHIKLYIAGQKGAVFAKNEWQESDVSCFIFPDETHYRHIVGLGNQLIDDYLAGEIDEVVIIYQNFVSKLTQEATQKVLLPLEMSQVAPNKGLVDEIFPGEKEVCEEMLRQYVLMELYHVFLTANLSEHAARMNAMSGATDNAQDIIKESMIIYNRARQATITQELSEIVAGANAVSE